MIYYASWAIDESNNLWRWGTNYYGVIGDNTIVQRSKPVFIGAGYSELLSNSITVFARKTDNSIFCWGANPSGQLGLSDIINRSSPVIFDANGSAWADIQSESGTTIGLKTNGTLWSWGLGDVGALGTNNILHRSSPVQVGTDNTWSKIAIGADAVYAIKTNGTLWIWGSGQRGAWGNNLPGTSTIGRSPGRSSPLQLGTDTNWQKIKTFYPGCFALKSNGSVWAWGYLVYGIRGDNLASPTDVSSPMQVFGNFVYTDIDNGGNINAAAKRNDGTIWGLGYLSNGVNSVTSYSSPVQIAPSFRFDETKIIQNDNFLALKTVEAIVAPTATPPIPTPTATPAPQNGMFVWGNNTNGVLGLNDTVHRSDFIQLGTDAQWSNTRVKNITSSDSNHTIAVKYDGTIWGWGDNTYSQIGIGDKTHRSSPVQIGTTTDWANAVAAAYYSVGVKTDGSLWTWGRNANGYLGNNQGSTDQPYPFRIGLENNWSQQIEHLCAGHHGAAIKTNGTLWMWGYNGQGQIGDNSTVHRSSPVQLAGTTWAQVSTGGSDVTIANAHTVAVKTDGTLWTWGYNASGQLGLNTATNRSSPAQVAGTNWKYAKASFGGTVAIKTNGTLWGWGDYFVNATGTYNNASSPIQVGTSTSWATNIRSFDAKYKSAAAIDPSEFYVLKSWGDGTDGGQDAGSTVTNITPTTAGGGLNWTSVYQGYSRAFGMSDSEMAFTGPILDLDPRNYTNGQSSWPDTSALSNNATFPLTSTYGINNSAIKFSTLNSGVFYPMGARSSATYTNLYTSTTIAISSSKSLTFNSYVNKFSFEIWTRITPSIITQSVLSTPIVTLQVLTDGKIRATLTLANNTVINCDTTNSYDNFNFHHIVVTHSSTSLKLYVNGSLAATATTGILKTGTGIITGGGGYCPIAKIKGWYNYELNSTEIANLYTSWSNIAGYSAFTNVDIFNYTGAIQSWVCPAGVTQICVAALGTIGGSATDAVSGTVAGGGNGGSAVAVLPVTAGTTYYLVVGGGGTVSGATYGFGGTGGSGVKSSISGTIIAGGRGGGLTGMFTSSTAAYANALIVAGGGGGGSQVPVTDSGGNPMWNGAPGGAAGIENSQGEPGPNYCYANSGCVVAQTNNAGIVGSASYAPPTQSGGVTFTGSSTLAGGNGSRGAVAISTSPTIYAVAGGGGAGANGGTSGGISCSAKGLNPTYPNSGSSCGQGAGGGATYVKNTSIVRWHIGFNNIITQNGKLWIAY